MPGGIRGEACRRLQSTRSMLEAHSATSRLDSRIREMLTRRLAGAERLELDETDSRVAPISCKFVVQFCKVLDLPVAAARRRCGPAESLNQDVRAAGVSFLAERSMELVMA